MRKKLTALALVLILALTCMLSACGEDGMFRKNEERDLKQITASATYNDRIALIDKGDLNASVNQYINTLVQYYSNGYITATQYYNAINDMEVNYEGANESLGKSALFALYCLDYVAESYKDDAEKYAKITEASTKGKTYDFKKPAEYEQYIADRIAEYEAVFTTEQLNDVRKELNEEFKTQFDNYREEVLSEIELSKLGQTIPEGAVSITVTPPDKLIYEVGDEFDTDGLVVEAVYEDDTKVIIEEDYEVTGFTSEAIAEDLEITVTYEDLTTTFEVDIVEARPTRPQKEVEEEEEPYPTDGEGKMLLIEKYDFVISQEDYDDRDEYGVDKEAMRRVITVLEESYRDYDYYYLNKLETKITKVCEEIIHSSVKVTTDDIDDFYDIELQKEMESYLSSEYGTATLENAPFTTIAHAITADKGIFYVKHILFKFNTEQTEAIKRYTDEKTGNEEALQTLREEYAELIGVWLSNPEYDEDCEEEDCPPEYLNETPINVLEVIADIESDLADIRNSASYADEAEKMKALMEKFDEWIYKANEDDGIFETLSEKGLGYMVPPTGMESGYVKQFEELSRQLAAQGLGAGDWCVTEYGIHYIIVTGYASDVEPEVGADYVNLPLDYIVNGLNYEVITSGDEYKVYTNETDFDYVVKGTLEQYIYDSVYSKKTSDLFASFQKEFYNEYTETNITYYPKTYKDTVKELQGNLKG